MSPEAISMPMLRESPIFRSGQGAVLMSAAYWRWFLRMTWHSTWTRAGFSTTRN